MFTTGASDNDIILRNAVKLEQIPDPVEPVETIMKRCTAEQLMQLYKIPQFTTVNQFLMHIANKKGKLKAVSVSRIYRNDSMMLQVNNCYS